MRRANREPNLLIFQATLCEPVCPRRRPQRAVECALALERIIEALSFDEVRAWPKGLRVRAADGNESRAVRKA